MPLTILLAGFLIFLAAHLVPTFVPLRRRLVQQLGENAYKAIFSLVSLAGLVLIVIGKARAEVVAVWSSPAWGAAVAPYVMPLAFILLAGAYLPGNLGRYTCHPMLWGVTLWAAVHLLANGDLASIVLFGGFGAYALFAMVSQNRRGRQKQAVAVPVSRDIVVVVAGLIAYAAFLWFHPLLFGVPAIPA